MKAFALLFYCLASLPCARLQGQAVRLLAGKKIRHLVMYGQSNMLGTTSVPVISTTGIPMALMFTGGIRSGYDSVDTNFYSGFVPLAEKQVKSRFTGALLGETPASGCVEAIAGLLREDASLSGQGDAGFAGAYLLVSSAAQGSSSVADLTTGASWSRFEQDIVEAHRLAIAAKLDYDVPVILWNQGERDIDLKTTAADYKMQLHRFQQKADKFIRSVTGQKHAVRMILYQTASHNVRKSPHDPSIANAQYELAKTDPFITMSAPAYCLPYSRDAVHFSNVGSKWNGALHGVAVKSIIFDHKPWKPIFVKKILQRERTLELTFHVPVPPLVLDTVAVSDPGNYGFNVSDGAGAELKIDHITVTGDRILISTASAIPKGSLVWYGNNGTGTGSVNGARGNLRDSQGDRYTIDISGERKRLDNWTPIFKEAIPPSGAP